MAQNISYEDVKAAAVDAGPLTLRAEFTLTVEDTAWDPTSTKRLLRGPGTVVYVQHPDGGWQATTGDTVSRY